MGRPRRPTLAPGGQWAADPASVVAAPERPSGVPEGGGDDRLSPARNAGLTAGEDVLDVGCGSGRVALPLISILGPDGSYEGFDVVPEAVAWSRRRITAAHPNFRFQLADVHSDH